MKASLYNHPRVVWLLLLLIVISGLNSFYTMPRLEDPHMPSRVVRVTTFYPGADAERVEAEITEKLERKMREVPEIKEIHSSSSSGISVITIELDDRVKDAKRITARLRDKVAEVTDLPTGISPPDFNDTQIYAYSSILALTWEASSLINYAILGRHAEEIASQLRNFNNTDFVNIIGLPQEEIRISVDDAILASYGLTMADLTARIQGSDARGTAGVVTNSTDRMIVKVTGALDSLARIRAIPIGFDEAAGASLRLGDIAKVDRTFENPVSRLTYLDGTYGIIIAARMFEVGRIGEWSQEVGRAIENFQSTLPGGVKLERIFDQSKYADERLNGLMGTLAIGALVVLVVLFFALGWRASLVTASILPLTLLASLTITDMFGLRLEQMLVIGLIVALGIMVDNAIVMTDEIQQLRLKGYRRSTSVAMTIKKLWLPLLGSTVTTIIAFMPLILMPGNEGDFLIGVPGAVISALIASYVIAFTIISAVAGRLVEGRDPAQSAQSKKQMQRIWWRDGFTAAFISRPFRKSLEWSVRRPFLSISVAMAIPVLGFVMASGLTEQFFPDSDRNQFRLQIHMPGQTSIDETRLAAEFVHKKLQEIEEIESAHWYIGTAPAKYYYSIITNGNGAANLAQAMVTVDTYSSIPKLIPKLQQELTALLPEAIILVLPLSAGPPVQAPIELKLTGPDLVILESLGEEIRAIVNSIPSVTFTRTSLNIGRPMISVAAREDDASVAGLSLKQVEQQIQALTSGAIVSYVIEQTQQVPVRLIADKTSRMDVDSIANLSLRGTTTFEQDKSFADVPVSAVAEVKLATKVGVVNHLNGVRINSIQAFLDFGVLPQIPLEQVQNALEKANLDIPPGYQLEYGGESKKRDEAVQAIFGTAGMLIVLMILAIVLTFNSFRMAMVTFGAAVQAAGLGLFSLALFDYPLSFVVIFGSMGLIGLAINAAIVILSELRGRADARAGNAEAVVDGVMATGRHIISTTLTTVGGFMPLIIAGGPFWPPFAVAIAGGAFLSMIVSFYFAPAAFLVLTRRRAVTGPGAAQNPSRPADATL
ncbi:MAG: efflux RND transporter permease subunit [Kordiimonadaceae bacterium]|nr:efflux RND transporter permease subunit [Kordiimonadaceae bacterium]